MDTVCWGLLSTANINRKLIPAIAASPRGRLVAVASRDQAKAEAYARQWEIPLAFGSYQALLDSDKLDAVYISLPNHLHAEWSIKALQAGKHVLCEKPVALSLEDIDAMIAASQKSGRVIAEAVMYRHHPQTKIVGDWVQKGRIGEPFLMRGEFSFKLTQRDNVRLKPELGGGSLWDIGIYPLSLAQFIFKMAPTKVNGFHWLGETGVDETFIGNMYYSNGAMAQLMCSYRTEYFTRAEIIGTQGRLELTRPFNALEEHRKLIYHPDDGEPYEIPVPDVELYSGEIEDMHAAILDGSPQYVTLAETRNHVQTLLALYESARTGQNVDL